MTNNLSMQELLDQEEQALSKIKVGEIITGKVIKITSDEVILGLDYGFDGSISIDELNIEKGKYADEVYKIGDEITGVITKVYQKDGVIKLSKLAADKANDFVEIEKAFEEHRIITVNVERSIEKGLFANYKTHTFFIPISHIDTKFVKNTNEYIGRNLEVYIIELNQSKNKFVASHRDVLQERLDKEREERRARIKAEKEAERARIKADREAERARIKAEKEELFDSLEVGQKREGKVTKIMTYGAFVDIGGLEGLAHINNLSWKRVESVEDVLQEGQDVEVYVLDVDRETRRIALALKDINNDPWNLISKELEEGDIITGKVVRIIEKGAFVEIREGVDAYLPISELSDDRVVKVTNVVNVDDEIKVKVLNFKPKDKRMLVSIKEANREPEEDISEYMEVEESLGTLGDLLKDKFKDLEL
ncbi:30S ribosomal protein S1 [Asaccharospora irregularis]|uniref:Small subunit ribosomal protein S1 n=1 Tax=Asaccharospora irregularis DSM 2635 TaxID=1121321 RepID=A0A1M5NYR9_9FIRM|nr:S1 RNA-binding domain-containing protein [Asaccharospora irregularis]SHG94680.1 small subunit ribosomal protein S1 [Asaccharospora irregularis DSM 2635]